LAERKVRRRRTPDPRACYQYSASKVAKINLDSRSKIYSGGGVLPPALLLVNGMNILQTVISRRRTLGQYVEENHFLFPGGGRKPPLRRKPSLCRK